MEIGIVSPDLQQIKTNPALTNWFNNILSEGGIKLSDILDGDINVEIGIYGVPSTELRGVTKWEGIFRNSGFDEQPNQSIGLNHNIFNDTWYRTDTGDERAAATTIIHELAHYSEAYALGKVWPNKPANYYDTGAFVESLVNW